MRKGIALIVTILVLLVISVLAAALMIMATTETQIAKYHIQSVKTLEYAQAGFNEVVSRLYSSDPSIAIGDTSEVPNPDWTVILSSNFVTDPDPTDNIFFTSTTSDLRNFYTSEINPSDPDTWNNAIIIRYKRSATDSSKMYFYDPVSGKQILGPPTLAGKYFPVIQVDITGRDGRGNQKTIRAEVSKGIFSSNVPAAISGKGIGVSLRGHVEMYICGHNHTYDVPWADTTINFSSCSPYHYAREDGSAHPIEVIEYDSLCGNVGCVPGITTDDASLLERGHRSDFEYHGNPDIVFSPGYTPPPLWKILGYADSMELENEISSGKWTVIRSFPNDSANSKLYVCNGDLYVTDRGRVKNLAKGVLWVRGNLYWDMRGRVVEAFKGIIYVDGDLTKSTHSGGRAVWWTLGTTIVRGNIDPDLKGRLRLIFLYSGRAVEQARETVNARGFRVLGWKEIAE